MALAPNLLAVTGLEIGLKTEAGVIPLVSDVSFDLGAGEMLGIVGESGSGKSITLQALLQLLVTPLQITSGTAMFGERDLLHLSPREMQAIRGGEICVVFQEPSAYLSPVHSVGDQLTEVLRLHHGLSGRSARERAIELLQHVGIPAPRERMRSFAHELSGGMCQRVMLALALAGEPRLLLADEPTTALDVTIQAQILEILATLRQETGMAVILVSHDLRVVSQMCQRVLVMYAGHIMEQGRVEEVFLRPRHPYTRGLLAAIPLLEKPRQHLRGIPGNVPAPGKMPTGCRFAPRCAHAKVHCTCAVPPLRAFGESLLRCVRAEELGVLEEDDVLA